LRVNEFDVALHAERAVAEHREFSSHMLVV
jgi:hypothetical protein